MREISEEANGGIDEGLPGAIGDADIADVEGEWAEAFVGVDFGASSIFEDGYGSVADEDIEELECARECGGLAEAAEFCAYGEGGFEDFGEEEGAEEFVIRDVCEEIGVMFAVCREDMIEGDGDDIGGLFGLYERGFFGVAEGGKSVEKEVFEQSGIGDFLGILEELIEAVAEARAGGALGKVEIAEQIPEGVIRDFGVLWGWDLRCGHADCFWGRGG